MQQKANYPNYNLSAGEVEYAGEMQKIASYLFNNVDTVQPVEVVSVAQSEQGQNVYVNVKPVLQQNTTTGADIPITDADIIYNVPLMMFYGNGCEFSFTVTAGDKGLLIASKFDISVYKKLKKTAPLGGLKMFRFNSSFYLPFDFAPHGNNIVIRNQDTKIEVMPKSIIITTTDATINASNSIVATTKTATINAQEVNLGGTGGQPIARVGDAVQVNVTSGSSAGTWSGTITAGSSVSKST